MTLFKYQKALWQLRKKRKDDCYLCGNPAETRDHIPPKGIFDNPRPNDLITVPACLECNSKFAVDDEYFRWFVATVSAEDSTAEKLIDNRILPRFKKRPALLNRILQGVRRVDIYSEGGIWVDQRPAFEFNPERIQRVVEKVVKGLYWRHKGHRLGNNYSVADFIWNPKPPNEDAIRNLRLLPVHAVGRGEVFCYQYFKYSKDDGITGWFLWFFKKTLILDRTALKPPIQKMTSNQVPVDS